MKPELVADGTVAAHIRKPLHVPGTGAHGAMADALLEQVADPIVSLTADGAYDRDQVSQQPNWTNSRTSLPATFWRQISSGSICKPTAKAESGSDIRIRDQLVKHGSLSSPGKRRQVALREPSVVRMGVCRHHPSIIASGAGFPGTPLGRAGMVLLDRDRGTPHAAAPATPPGLRVTYPGGSIGLCRCWNMDSGKTRVGNWSNAHPGPASVSLGRLADITYRTVSSTGSIGFRGADDGAEGGRPPTRSGIRWSPCGRSRWPQMQFGNVDRPGHCSV
jgi:hypothetical protein